MKCLVIGGGGFIGSHLCEELLQQNHTIKILQRKKQENLLIEQNTDKIQYIEGNYSDLSVIKRALEDVEIVFHLASTTIPQKSNLDPIYDINSNLIATVQMLEESRKLGVKKIIYFSSGGTIYGIPQQTPIKEDHPSNPICSYGIHKLAVEKYLHLYFHLYGIDYASLRISNPFGERQNFNRNQGVVSVFINKILNNEPIEIWGDGLTVRDYIYVKDVATAAIAAMHYEGENKIFNIGSGVGATLNDIVSIISKLINKEVLIEYSTSRNLDVPLNILDISKAQEVLKWSPNVNLEDGIHRTIEYFQKGIET